MVSLLLDTGVVDVDQCNRAGYTAVMLASLADVQTDTQREVVLRLFHSGNVNLQASQVLTDTQTDRQTQGQRQTDTQTDRQTDRHTDRQTDSIAIDAILSLIQGLLRAATFILSYYQNSEI